MLRLEQVSVTFDDFTAVDAVDLEAADGEIICVLGPSGSGKSSLLRAVAGLERDATGVVSWDGADLAGVPPHRRGFGLMFQDHALFPHRDVIGNVAFGLRMQRIARAEIEPRAREALALVGMSGFERRRVTELSGGEQQRVALARALAAAPRLLMLDEPLGALDRSLRDRLVTELRALFVRLELTTLFVTHDHDEAFALADRLVIMHEGRIEQVGTPTDVWRRPANGFVAGFLGWNVTDAFGSGLVAIRPDEITVVDRGTVTGRVAARAFHREHFLLRVDLAPDAAIQVAVPLDAEAVPAVGERVELVANTASAVELPEEA
jgi:thiamine transport system ATP-binding protein